MGIKHARLLEFFIKESEYPSCGPALNYITRSQNKKKKKKNKTKQKP